MAPVVVEDHHRSAGFYAAIFVPLILSVALATGGFFAWRRFRHHFKYNRIVADDGERQTLSMELPNTSAVYEKARDQAMDLSTKAREQAREYGEKARVQATEYGTKARGFFKVPDTTGLRSYIPDFASFTKRFSRVKATDEEAAKLEFELPEDKAKKEDEESSEEEDEEEEEEEVPSGKAPLLEGKTPKWGTESKKAELKTGPGAPQTAYDPIASTGRAPTKTSARK
jgi:hypothetical protein